MNIVGFIIGGVALHLISAWGADRRLLPDQLAIDSKSNEITAVPKLLHSALDVTMNEDHTRSRKDHGLQNTALVRKLALSMARTEPSKRSMKSKFKQAGWDDAFLAKLLAQNPAIQMR